MAFPRGKIDDCSQVMIPLEIREQLGIEPKDLVEFEVADGRVVLTPLRTSIFDYFMTVPALETPMSENDLNEAFEQGVADELAASMAPTPPSR